MREGGDGAMITAPLYPEAARKIRNGAVRWTSSIAYHCSSVVFWMTLSQV
jgi:hypothetical protein